MYCQQAFRILNACWQCFRKYNKKQLDSLIFMPCNITLLCLFEWVTGRPVALITVTFTCIVVMTLLLWATGPESLTINLRTGWYVHKEPRTHVVKAGLTTDDLAGVGVVRAVQLNIGKPSIPIYKCELAWNGQKRMLLGRFESRGEAEYLAKQVSSALKVPITAEPDAKTITCKRAPIMNLDGTIDFS